MQMDSFSRTLESEIDTSEKLETLSGKVLSKPNTATGISVDNKQKKIRSWGLKASSTAQQNSSKTSNTKTSKHKEQGYGIDQQKAKDLNN